MWWVEQDVLDGKRGGIVVYSAEEAILVRLFNPKVRIWIMPRPSNPPPAAAPT